MLLKKSKRALPKKNALQKRKNAKSGLLKKTTKESLPTEKSAEKKNLNFRRKKKKSARS